MGPTQNLRHAFESYLEVPSVARWRILVECANEYEAAVQVTARERLRQSARQDFLKELRHAADRHGVGPGPVLADWVDRDLLYELESLGYLEVYRGDFGGYAYVLKPQ